MKAWWRERGLRKGVERKFEEEDKEHRHLPLLVVQLPQGTAFLLSSRIDSAVKAAAVNYSAEHLGKGSGPKRLLKYHGVR